MIKYILERIMIGIVTMILIITINFFLLQLLPGSPFNSEKLTTEQIEMLNEAYGFNDPLPVQYVRYLSKIVQGDFGISIINTNIPVADLIYGKLPHTIKVGGLALLIGAVIGLFLGSVAALNRNSFWDYFTITVAILGVSIPGFVFGAVLQLFFGLKLDLVPIIYKIGDPRSFILPAVALAYPIIASTARYMRTELVEIFNSDYILLARAKGLTRRAVVYKHAIRNALIPVITVLGPATIVLIGGSTVIERIFGIPGIGNLMVDGINTRDHFVILGCAIFYSLLFIVILLIIDVIYGVIDPRIRVSGGMKN